MRHLRKHSEIRKPVVNLDFCQNSYGSVLFEMGNTKIICAVSISNDVPEHAKIKGNGWLTAEYSILPYSTNPRTKRDLFKKDGRSVEIQRLIGRSFRNVIDLSLIKDYLITIDCDVLQADGGTRTASITGGFIALKLGISRMIQEGKISVNPLLSNIAAISTGIVKGEMLLDLDYNEDHQADVDLNIVMDKNFSLIEIQGTGEQYSFTHEQLNSMIDLAKSGIGDLFQVQNKY